MKRNLLAALACVAMLVCGQTANADITLTHSASQTIEAGSVSCNGGGLHTDNSYWRSFDLAAFGVTDDFTIDRVDIGIETATSAGGEDIPGFINFYTGDISMGSAGLTLIDTVSADVANGTSLELLSFAADTTISAGSTLVVEYFTPEGQTDGRSLFVGSNAAGQTDASYISAEACGIMEPIDLAAIGFANMHIVMNVHGTTSAIPEPTTAGLLALGLVGFVARRRR